MIKNSIGWQPWIQIIIIISTSLLLYLNIVIIIFVFNAAGSSSGRLISFLLPASVGRAWLFAPFFFLIHQNNNKSTYIIFTIIVILTSALHFIIVSLGQGIALTPWRLAIYNNNTFISLIFFLSSVFFYLLHPHSLHSTPSSSLILTFSSPIIRIRGPISDEAGPTCVFSWWKGCVSPHHLHHNNNNYQHQ